MKSFSIYNLRLFLLLTSVLLFILSSAQDNILNKKKSIEINTYVQWDSYPTFTTSINTTTSATTKMKGISWGVAANYRYGINRKVYVKAGIGYYKYAFNNILQSTTVYSRNARLINYRDGSSTFGHVCDKYWYNTITAKIGAELSFDLKKNIDLMTGLDIINYFSFSQRYNIPASNGDKSYKETDTHYFAFSTNLSAHLRKNFNKIGIGPSITIPVFNYWKQDFVFPGEANNLSRNKWLKGIGVGLTCTYYITQN